MRLRVLLTTGLILAGCGGGAASGGSHIVYTSLVEVSFSGSAQITNAPYSDITYHWAEYLVGQVTEANVVQEGTIQDHLSGLGVVNGLYASGGGCSADYTAPSTSTGTIFGARILNQGSDLIVTAKAPWGLYNISGFSGSTCNPPADPSSRLMDDLVPVTNDFRCVLDSFGASCHQTQVLPKGAGSRTYTGSVTFEAKRSDVRRGSETYSNDVYVDDFLNGVFRSAITPQALRSVQQSGNPNLSLSQSGLPPAHQNGNVSIQMSLQGVPLAAIEESVQSGVVPQPTVRFNTSGVAAALALKQATPVQVTANFTPTGGQGVTLDQTFYYLPTQTTAPGSSATSAKPSIAGVRFSGTATNPMLVITGQNLGTEPPASPSAHVSGQNGCPSFTGDRGYDYGTSLYIILPGGVSAGRYRPERGETDCIDLVVTTFSPTEIDITLGSFYSQQYPKYSLSAGGAYEVVVNGATYGGTVAYT